MTDTLESFMQEHISTFEMDKAHYAYSLPTEAVSFENSDSLIREAQRHGHYFDANTMRIFRTKTYELYGGRFLVISNRYQYDGADRFYKVVWLYDSPATCSNPNHVKRAVNDLSTGFDTLAQARKAAATLAKLVDGVES